MAGGPSKNPGLKGHLEDLPLIDMLQIVAFSKKTGYLEIEGPRGHGGVVFKDGLVVCAYSWSTLKYLKQIGDDPRGGHQVAILEKQIEISLRELASVKEGRFNFQVTSSVPRELEGMPVTSFLLDEGISPEGLLLELAKDFDEERKETSELLEASGHPSSAKSSGQPLPPPPSPGDGHEADLEEQETSVLLVDDEPPVREIVGAALRAAGYRVYSASSPAEGMGIASELTLSKKKMLVITDLGMPTTSGRSFRGGLELARCLQRAGLRAPLLLMTEKLSGKTRARAQAMGIRKVALKPALSKLDPEQYERDLRDFATTVIRLLPMLDTFPVEQEPPAPSTELAEDTKSAPFLDYLASMTEQLLNPRRPVDISQLVLQVASKYLDRAVLFLIRAEKARGLGGFGFVSTKEDSVEIAHKIVFNLHQARPFAEVAYSGKTKRFGAELERLQAPLFSAIGRGRATECVLIPMLNNGEVLVILYGDNAESGRPIGKLRGLELFIGQAGMILENTFLHQKLRAFGARLSRSRTAPPSMSEVNGGQ